MLPTFLKSIGVRFSLNDPQWGRRPGSNKPEEPRPDQPPELDQLWRDWTQKLSTFFGFEGGGGTGGGAAKSTGIGLGVVLGVVALIWVLSGFFIVQEGQTAVITTFGKYSHSTSAGFNWRWPYPIQSHEIVNVSQVRKVEVGHRGGSARESLMLTDDENIVDIQFAVQFKLKDAAAWLFNNRDQEEMVKQVAETAIREIVGKSKMDFVLYEGREKVAQDLGVLMQQILDRYQAGVQITNITMQGAQPPEQVQAAFDDAVKAGQDRERQKNEGQAYANEIIPKAKGEASRILQDAEAYKARVVATAEGNAARFRQVLTEYQKAPAVTRDRMYLETMQSIFSSVSKVVVDGKGNNNMIYLPLEKWMSSSENKPAVAPAVVAPAQEPVSTVELRYSRENRDSRAREGRDVREREAR